MSVAEQAPQLERKVEDVTPCASPRSVASSRTQKSPSSGSANSWSTVSAPGGDMRPAPIDTSAPQDGGVPSVANSTLPSALDTSSSTAMDSAFSDQATVIMDHSSLTDRRHSQALIPYEELGRHFHGFHHRPDFLSPHQSPGRKGEAPTRGCSPDSFVESPQPHPITIPPQNSPVTLTRIRSCSSHSRSSTSRRPRCILIGSDSEGQSPRRGRSRSPRGLGHVAGYPPGYAYISGGPPSADPSPIMHPMDTYPQLPPSPIWSPTSPPSAPRVIVPLSGDLSMFSRPVASPTQVALPTPSMSEDYNWSPSSLLRRRGTKSSREGSTASRSTLSALSEVQDFHRLSPRGPRSPFMAARVPLPASIQPSPRRSEPPLSVLGSDAAAHVPLPESHQPSPRRETLHSPSHVRLPPSLPESQHPTPSCVALPPSGLASPTSMSRYSSEHGSSLGYSPYSGVESYRRPASEQGSWSDISVRMGAQGKSEWDAQSQSRYSAEPASPGLKGGVAFPTTSTPSDTPLLPEPPLPVLLPANAQDVPERRAHHSSGLCSQDLPSRSLPVPPVAAALGRSPDTSPSQYSQPPFSHASTRSRSPSCGMRSPSPETPSTTSSEKPWEIDCDAFNPFGFIVAREDFSHPRPAPSPAQSHLDSWRESTRHCDIPEEGGPVSVPMTPSTSSGSRKSSRRTLSPDYAPSSRRSSALAHASHVSQAGSRRSASHLTSPKDERQSRKASSPSTIPPSPVSLSSGRSVKSASTTKSRRSDKSSRHSKDVSRDERSSQVSGASRSEPPRVDIASARAIADAIARANAKAHADATAHAHIVAHTQAAAQVGAAVASDAVNVNAEPVTAISLPSPRSPHRARALREQVPFGTRIPDVPYTPPISPYYLGSPLSKVAAPKEPSPSRVSDISSRSSRPAKASHKSSVAGSPLASSRAPAAVPTPSRAPLSPISQAPSQASSRSRGHGSHTPRARLEDRRLLSPSRSPLRSSVAPRPLPIEVDSSDSNSSRSSRSIPPPCPLPSPPAESSPPHSCSRSVYHGYGIGPAVVSPNPEHRGRGSRGSHGGSEGRRPRSRSVHNRWDTWPRAPSPYRHMRSPSRTPIYRRPRLSASPSRSTCTTHSRSSRAGRPREDSCQRSSTFYFTDGTLYVKVESIIYRIYKHFFERSSPVWRDMLRERRTGRTESDPLVLKDIKAADFDQILCLIYPDFVTTGPTTAEQWIGILELVMLWKVDVLRSLAISSLEPLALTVDKLVLGERYGIEGWAKAAYKDLCLRRAPLSKEEGRKLGVDAVVRINEMKYAMMENLGNLVDGEKLAGVVEGVMKE
ncbi:hypothetical protein HDZ31DRAFT_37742 [Schizophyllum fasciatum]